MKEVVVCRKTFLGGTCPARNDPLDYPSPLLGAVAVSVELGSGTGWVGHLAPEEPTKSFPWHQAKRIPV